MLLRFKTRVIILVVISTYFLVYLFSGLSSLFKYEPEPLDQEEFPFVKENKGLESNCKTFFQEFIKINQTWNYPSMASDPKPREQCIAEAQMKRSRKTQQPVTEEVLEEFKQYCEDQEKQLAQFLVQLKFHMLASRVYDRCFIQESFDYDEKISTAVEPLLFPWIENEDTGSFLQQSILSSSGKGIVISASNAHYDDLVSLILVLRGLGNTLPIEVIHRNDLSEAKQYSLEQVAKGFVNMDLFAEHYKGAGLSQLIDTSFPPQHISFKDLHKVLRSPLKKKIRSFSNKVIAMLFSSYEEVIMMDADTVPFIPPQDFFKLQGYPETGAYFFRDRELADISAENDRHFWKRLFPGDKEAKLFNHKIDSSKFEDSIRYLKGFTHFMESGIVIMDRKKHAGSLITAAQLQLVRSATQKVWGDKEFFWLAMLISGDDQFSINDQPAGALGHASELPDHEYEACSVQPVHVSNGQLLWMNSGFKVCKKTTILTSKIPLEKIDVLAQHRANKKPVTIDRVIIPPNLDEYYLDDQVLEKDQVKSWRNTKVCEAFEYCARPSVVINGRKIDGEIIDFSSQQKLDFSFIGELWSNAIYLNLTSVNQY